jgi:putative ABC transport system substrate-binding protein
LRATGHADRAKLLQRVIGDLPAVREPDLLAAADDDAVYPRQRAQQEQSGPQVGDGWRLSGSRRWPGRVDPVGYGFGASMARPGGNITGLSSDTGIELVGKHLEVLKELSPQSSRIGFLAPRAIFRSPYFRALEEAARVRALPLVQLPLESPITHAEYERVFGIAATSTDALLVADVPENFANRKKIAALARVHRLPAVYPSTPYARSGGLVSYGYDPVEGFRRAAHFVDRILKGANPAEMPFEQPSRLYLIVNLKAAQAANIAVPEAMSARADEVIE